MIQILAVFAAALTVGSMIYLVWTIEQIAESMSNIREERINDRNSHPERD